MSTFSDFAGKIADGQLKKIQIEFNDEENTISMEINLSRFEVPHTLLIIGIEKYLLYANLHSTTDYIESFKLFRMDDGLIYFSTYPYLENNEVDERDEGVIICKSIFLDDIEVNI